jgi:hypothetical protein
MKGRREYFDEKGYNHYCCLIKESQKHKTKRERKREYIFVVSAFVISIVSYIEKNILYFSNVVHNTHKYTHNNIACIKYTQIMASGLHR